MPSGEVLLEAINLYQNGIPQTLGHGLLPWIFPEAWRAMASARSGTRCPWLLTPEKAREYLLQPGSEDVTTIIAFNDALIKSWTVRGNNPDTLGALLDSVKSLEPRGGHRHLLANHRGP